MAADMAATPSSKSLICYFHVGGDFVANGESQVKYNGGSVRVKSLKEGMKLEELRVMIGDWFGIDGDIKYTLSFDENILVDMVNDDEMENLFTYNERSAHVYVGCKGTHIAPREMDDQERVHQFVDLTEQMTYIEEPMSYEASDDYANKECSGIPLLSLLCASQSAPTPMPVQNSNKWKDLVIGVNQTFAHSDEFKKVLHKFSIAHKFEYTYVKNARDCVYVKCKVEDCPLRITARAIGKSNDFLRVTRYTDLHDHTAQDNLQVTHARSTALTSSIIIEEVRNHTDKRPNDIKNSLARDYGVHLTYKQAYRAKEKAMEEIHGRPEQTYMLIPWICDRLKETDDKTVAEWVASGSNTFERVFIAYGCCIEGFISSARPVLYIDGSHLSGPYRGTLLSASAFDADNELLSFALAIVHGETIEDWTWFLEMVRRTLGGLQIIIVSDRHNAIIAAVRAVFGSERHAYCYRHIKENFSAQMLKLNKGKRKICGQQRETALQLLDAIAYARLDCDFESAMEQMRLFNQEAFEWLIHHGDIDKWAMSKFPFQLWDKITTNLAESFNAWMVKERHHNVAQLIHEHRDKVAKKMYAASMAMSKWKNGVGPNIEQHVLENVARAEYMDVLVYGRGRVQVRTASGALMVELNLRKCTFKAWQMSGIPCPHACAAVKGVHGNVYNYIDEYLTLTAQKKIYSRTMTPVVTIDMPNPNDIHLYDIGSEVFLAPPKTSRPPGRPRVERIESQFRNKKIYHCRSCHQEGHTRKNLQKSKLILTC